MASLFLSLILLADFPPTGSALILLAGFPPTRTALILLADLNVHIEVKVSQSLFLVSQSQVKVGQSQISIWIFPYIVTRAGLPYMVILVKAVFYFRELVA